MFKVSIPFEFDNGSSYIVELSEMPGFDFEFQIVDIVLIRISGVEPTSFQQLSEITNAIGKEIIKNNLITYYYCDTSEIIKRHKEYSPQEYRALLFDRLYKRHHSANLIKADIIIEADITHYISLITTVKNADTLELLKTEIESYSEKSE